jgi:TRAP-type transport system periplasmic protein
MKTIKWVIAHEPEELFVRAANHFVKELEQRQPGKFDIEVMTKSGFAHKYNDGQLESMDSLIKLAEDGAIDMAHTTTTSVARTYSNDFFALELPFLFESHEHATAVLDGPIGRQIRDTVKPMKSLAFTYSGGFRMLVGNKACHSVEDIASLSQRVNSGPVASRIFEAIGAETKHYALELSPTAIEEGLIDSSDCTYPRFYGMDFNKTATAINDTRHSLFATNILINNQTWNSLTADEQRDFQTAANLCATKERQESIDDIKITTERALRDGVTITSLSESERTKWKEATNGIYGKLEHLFTDGLVDAIRAANPA